MTKAKAKALPEVDTLNEFAGAERGFTERAIMLMFWKARHANPEFTITVDRADLKGFADCIKYLDVIPTIRVYRPQGLPAQQAIEAHGNRRAAPGRAAQPPKDYVVIQMVDQDGNAFVPIENNEDDLQRGKDGAAARRTRETAPQLAAQLEADIRANTISNATIQEAIEALRVLAQ